jgi:hypothetical protein
MGKRRAIFDQKNALAANQIRVVEKRPIVIAPIPDDDTQRRRNR